MKRTSAVWYILGAIVLIALGFAAGYVMNGGFARVAMMRGAAVGQYGRGMLMPGMLFGGMRFGLGWLMMIIFWLGPIAGIAALIIVLTRRQAAAPAPAPAIHSEPVAAVEPPAPTEPQPDPSAKK